MLADVATTSRTVVPRVRAVVLVQGRPYAIDVGRKVSATHHAIVHGPCFIGDNCSVGFNTTVHDAVIGEGCVFGLGAVVVGVSISPGRYVGHTVLVDTQDKADALPTVASKLEHIASDKVTPDHVSATAHWESRMAGAPSMRN